MTRDRYTALFFLALSIAYGVLATDIELYPGSEGETFTARTLPIVLGWVGGIVALLMLVMPSEPPEPSEPSEPSEPAPAARRFDWPRTGLLCVLMVLYGLTIRPVGFLISTSVFLAAGFAVLGTRDWKVFAFVPFPVTAGFEFMLRGLLGIYIRDPFLEMLGVIQ